ncbi:hypothetical protein JCM10450v2_004994 [Rhodotorula kratochvilovae]
MHPSPFSSAPPHLGALFASLPLELVKQIVAEVHEQDKPGVYPFKREHYTYPSAYGPQTAPPATPSYYREPQTTTWSYWYGRGVLALSCVDRRLRSLALPHLFETVTTKQLSAPYAIRVLPRSAVADMVRHVCLVDTSLPVPPVLHAAPALRWLTRATELTVGEAACKALGRAAYAETELGADVENALVAQAFHAFAERVETLAIGRARNSTLIHLIELLSGPKLKKLRLGSYSNVWAQNLPNLRAALAELNITHLAVWDDEESWDEDDERPVPEKVDASWFGGFCMPALTSFSFETLHPLTERFLEMVAQAFPNLERLILDVADETYAAPAIDPTRGISNQNLPHLRHLTLRGIVGTCPAFGQRLLDAVAGSPVTTLVLELAVTAPILPFSTLDTIFPSAYPLPPTLRTIALVRDDSAVPLHRCTEPDVVAWTEARGVTVNVEPWRQRPSDPSPARRALHANSFAEAERMLQASARDSLEWALARVDALARTGDTEALHELTAACEALRERKIIEEL